MYTDTQIADAIRQKIATQIRTKFEEDELPLLNSQNEESERERFEEQLPDRVEEAIERLLNDEDI